MAYKVGLLVLVIGGLAAFYIAYGVLTGHGKSCGGIAANLAANQCPFPLHCNSNSTMPDSMGTCTL